MTSGRTLSTRALNRALLARQLLLERADVSIETAVEQVGGLQTQYAPSGYVGLWTRLAGFRRDALTAALVDRSVVQTTLMRTTIHVVSRREFWRAAAGIRQARRAWALRVGGGDGAAMIERAERLRQALGDGPRTVRELGDLARGFVGNLGVWVDLVRVPPSGTWERRRADRLALAEDWVGRCDATEDEGLAHLVRAYLRAFGPAPWRDIAIWAGIPAADAARVGEAWPCGSTGTRMDASSLTCRTRHFPTRRPRRPSGSCRSGTRCCSPMPAAPGSCPRSTGRGSSRRRTPSRSAPTSSTAACAAPGRSRAAGSCSTRTRELAPRDRTAVEDEREALEAFHA